MENVIILDQGHLENVFSLYNGQPWKLVKFIYYFIKTASHPLLNRLDHINVFSFKGVPYLCNIL